MEDQRSASFWNASMQNNNEELDQLREDATQTARDIIEGVRENFISNDEFRSFHEQLDNRFAQIENTNQNIMNLINTLNERLNMSQENKNRPFERLDTPRPLDDNTSDNSSVRYDLDHDVIMRNRITYPLKQVPDPGNFTGDTKETELFCQLCEDTFRTYPNKDQPEEVKINFVKSRLRDSARNWYLAKYRDNIAPATMKEIIDGLKAGFRNVASAKLAKIELVNLKQNYGDINGYIEQFRGCTRQFNWDDETLTLLFYNGLHSSYQKEIDKAETFPTKLEDIITKCIIYESNQKAKNKIKQVSGTTKSNKTKNSNRRKSQYSKNNNYNNNNYNNHNYYNKNYNKYNSSQYNNNKDNNENNKATKISSKN